MARLVAEEKQHHNIVLERQAAQRALRSELTKLQDRAYQLRDYEIPSARRQIAGAQNDLAALEREATQRIELMRRHVASQERELANKERELANLTGDQKR